MDKKVIIIGATSGIGREVALIYIAQGWKVGVAGRREAELEALRSAYPEQVSAQALDVTKEDAPQKLQALIEQVGGMDVFLLSSGIGKQNPTLETGLELATAATNVEGFIRMTNAAFHYFEQQGHGHLAVISSIAGTKGLGAAPAYSATKGFQNIYMDALDQLARMKKQNIRFTDIRPGFVATPLLNNQKKYPMLMDAPIVALDIVSAIEKKKRVAIIDWKFRLLVGFWQLIPKWIWLRLPIKN
jgi:short-subunit dehydrogenase